MSCTWRSLDRVSLISLADDSLRTATQKHPFKLDLWDCIVAGRHPDQPFLLKYPSGWSMVVMARFNALNAACSSAPHFHSTPVLVNFNNGSEVRQILGINPELYVRLQRNLRSALASSDGCESLKALAWFSVGDIALVWTSNRRQSAFLCRIQTSQDWLHRLSARDAVILLYGWDYVLLMSYQRPKWNRSCLPDLVIGQNLFHFLGEYCASGIDEALAIPICSL